MNIKKTFLIFALLLMAATPISSQAMEETTTALTTIECLPAEVWNQIAQELPGNNAFLNRLARHFNLDYSCYTNIVNALLLEIEDTPLVDEIPHFIDKYLKTTHSSEIDTKIKNAFTSIVYSHKFSQHSAHIQDIRNLCRELLDSFDANSRRFPDIRPSINSAALAIDNRTRKREVLKIEQNKIKTHIMDMRYLQKLIHHYYSQAPVREKAMVTLGHYLPSHKILMDIGVIGMMICFLDSSAASQYVRNHFFNQFLGLLFVIGGLIAGHHREHLWLKFRSHQANLHEIRWCAFHILRRFQKLKQKLEKVIIASS